MKPIVLRGGVAAIAAAALTAVFGGTAEARTDVRTLTCARAQALVAQQGAVVFTTGQFTFDRFVSTPAQCGRNSRLAPQYVATSDNRQCELHICRGARSGDGTR